MSDCQALVERTSITSNKQAEIALATFKKNLEMLIMVVKKASEFLGSKIRSLSREQSDIRNRVSTAQRDLKGLR